MPEHGKNNPLKYTDPDGHIAIPVILAIIGIAIFLSQVPSDVYQSDPSRQGSADIQLLGMSFIGPVGDIASTSIQCISSGCDPVTATMSLLPGPNPSVVDNAIDDIVDDSDVIYRSMKMGDDGMPLVGSNSARELGARMPDDIVPTNGMVYPDTGGMSVSPGSPYNLPGHRRPPDFGGTGKDPVWCISTCNLGPDLSFRPDPANPTRHGFVEPVYPMSVNQYQQSLGNTRSYWRLVPQ